MYDIKWSNPSYLDICFGNYPPWYFMCIMSYVAFLADFVIDDDT